MKNKNKSLMHFGSNSLFKCSIKRRRPHKKVQTVFIVHVWAVFDRNKLLSIQFHAILFNSYSSKSQHCRLNLLYIVRKHRKNQDRPPVSKHVWWQWEGEKNFLTGRNLQQNKAQVGAAICRDRLLDNRTTIDSVPTSVLAVIL